MIDAQLTLDASAVLAYVSGSTGLGELLGEVAEEKHRFAVPAMCLVEAGMQLDEASWPMLDVATQHPDVYGDGIDTVLIED